MTEVSDGNTCPETITRTWTATDKCGNTVSESQTITIDDKTPPTFENLPSAIEIYVDNNGLATVPDLTGQVTVKDNCGCQPTITQTTPAGPFHAGDKFQVSFTAEDECGNKTSVSVSVEVLCGGCSGSTCNPGVGTIRNRSIDAKFQLGRISGGNSAGDLSIYAKKPSLDVYTPAFLKHYQNSSMEIIESNDVMRQIRTVQTFVDIVTMDEHSYELRYYEPAAAGSFVDGLYQVSGSPFVVWRIENPDQSTSVYNRVWISEIKEGVTNTSKFVWDDIQQGWTLNKGDGLKIETRTSAWDIAGVNRTEFYEVEDETGHVAVSEINEYHTFTWGERLMESIRDPDGVALTTQYSYYNDPGATGCYQNVERVVNPDGSFVWYEYDAQSRVTMTARPWNDSASQSCTTAVEFVANCQVTSNSYMPVDVNDDGSIWPRNPRSVTETVTGQIVAKTFCSYTPGTGGEIIEVREKGIRPDAEYGDSDNLRTRSVYYADNGAPWALSPKRIEQPDGQVQSDSYEYGTYSGGPTSPGTFLVGAGDYIRRTTVHGTVSSEQGIAYKTTKEIAVSSPDGAEVLSETYVYNGSGYEQLSWKVNRYDELSHLIAEYDSNGLKKEYDWSTGCCGMEKTVDQYGIENLYEYDALGRKTAETKTGVPAAPDHPAQPDVTTTYFYDAADRVVKTEQMASDLTIHIVSNKFNAAGQLVETIDAYGLKTTYTYTNGGRTISRALPGGATQVTDHYLDGRIKSVTGTAVTPRFHEYGVNADGSSWEKVVFGSSNSPAWTKTTTDMLGRTVRVEKPGFGQTVVTNSYLYNADGQLVRVTASDGHPDVLSEYNELGQQIRSGKDVNHSGQLELDSMDPISETRTSYVYDNGIWWEETVQKTYNQDGSAIPLTNSITRNAISDSGCGCGTSTSETIDLFGNKTVATVTVDPETKTVTRTVTTPDSTNNAVTLTVNGLLQSRQTQTGQTYTYLYDDLGRQIGIVDPRTGTNTTHYNTLGQIDYTEDAAGNRTTYTYDDLGRRIAVTDALSNTTHTAYDMQGRVTNTWGATYPVAYEYDEAGRMTAMKTWRDTNGVPDITTWQYDAATGLLTNKLYADGNGTAYTYTPDGKLASRTWARGIITEYTYDSLGQLTGISYGQSLVDVPISYTYNRAGQQMTITDVLGTRTNIYNALSQLTAEKLPDGTTLTRTHDALGRPSGIALGSDYTLTYGYDSYGRFSAISSSVSSVQSAVNYSYLQNSSLLSGYSVTPGGAAASLTVSRTYEPHRDLITSIQNTFDTNTISRFDYLNDAVGRRTERIDYNAQFMQALTNLFDYNPRSELTSALMSTNDYQYEFDPIGNRKEASLNANTNFYAANQLNQYTNILEGGAPATPLFYDADGNLTNYNGWTFTWNVENRLIMASNANVVVQNTYDYMGRRVSRTVLEGETVSSRTFIYDAWNMIAESDGAATPSSRYFVWGLDLSGTLQGAGGVGGLIAVIEGRANPPGEPFFACYDANGNITEYVDTNSAVAAYYQYDPYGNITQFGGAKADEMAYRFSTKYLDADTDMYYYGYRYYSPEMGRWISRDPIGEEGFELMSEFLQDTEYKGDLIDAAHVVENSDFSPHDKLQHDQMNIYRFAENNPVQVYDIVGLIARGHCPGYAGGCVKRQKGLKKYNEIPWCMVPSRMGCCEKSGKKGMWGRATCVYECKKMGWLDYNNYKYAYKLTRVMDFKRPEPVRVYDCTCTVKHKAK
jgi:RHS repeat-associated protein